MGKVAAETSVYARVLNQGWLASWTDFDALRCKPANIIFDRRENPTWSAYGCPSILFLFNELLCRQVNTRSRGPADDGANGQCNHVAQIRRTVPRLTPRIRCCRSPTSPSTKLFLYHRYIPRDGVDQSRQRLVGATASTKAGRILRCPRQSSSRQAAQAADPRNMPAGRLG